MAMIQPPRSSIFPKKYNPSEFLTPVAKPPNEPEITNPPNATDASAGTHKTFAVTETPTVKTVGVPNTTEHAPKILFAQSAFSLTPHSTYAL
ncbi:hypothetical protein SNK05_006178 [Fusarium graminearum]